MTTRIAQEKIADTLLSFASNAATAACVTPIGLVIPEQYVNVPYRWVFMVGPVLLAAGAILAGYTGTMIYERLGDPAA